jgi:hypothetical protein
MEIRWGNEDEKEDSSTNLSPQIKLVVTRAVNSSKLSA